MKALITGIAGFIGSHLAERLVRDGYEVIGIDAFTPFYDPAEKWRNLDGLRAKVDLCIGDLCEVNLPRILNQGVTHVFHLAAQAGVRGSWDGFPEYLHHNLDATQALLSACRDVPSIDRVVVASSSSVYGSCEGPVSEDALLRPESPYGVTKLAAEHLCETYRQSFQVPVVNLRYFTVYGPRQRPDMAIRRFIEAALDNLPLELYGLGNQTREFTYVEDVVEATVKAIDALSGSVFNVAGGSVCSVRDVVDLISRTLGQPVSVKFLDPKPGDVAQTWADTRQIRGYLGWAPQTSLEQGIAQTVAWCQAQRVTA